MYIVNEHQLVFLRGLKLVELDGPEEALSFAWTPVCPANIDVTAVNCEPRVVISSTAEEAGVRRWRIRAADLQWLAERSAAIA